MALQVASAERQCVASAALQVLQVEQLGNWEAAGPAWLCAAASLGTGTSDLGFNCVFCVTARIELPVVDIMRQMQQVPIQASNLLTMTATLRCAVMAAAAAAAGRTAIAGAAGLLAKFAFHCACTQPSDVQTPSPAIKPYLVNQKVWG